MKLLKNILHLLPALVLFISTTGVTLNKHYCMGRLKSVSVFHEAESCLSKFGRECPKNCCDYEQEEYKVEELNKANHNYDFSPELYLVSIVGHSLIHELLVKDFDQYPKYLNYKPPLIELDIPVRVQSFLL